jgi:GrpB-like predicted nucleotidyltransferase (UPF0157 family)
MARKEKRITCRSIKKARNNVPLYQEKRTFTTQIKTNPVMKQLTEMSDEELGTLFPIILTEHKKDWAKLYDQEERILYDTIGKNIYRIDHIGSTAVEQLIAKPTIDILLEINGETNTNELIKSLESIGYIYSPQPQKPAPHMMFMKGYTLQGFQGQAYHIHVRYAGHWDEPVFCHYLQTHPDVAHDYGELKKKLKEKYEHDREAYTEGKTEFIRHIVQLAKMLPKEKKSVSAEKEKYGNAYLPWEEKADNYLTTLYNQGKTIAELSDIFERGKGAIRSRLKHLELI